MKRLVFFLLLITSSLFALKKEPWYGQLAEFELNSTYGFTHYPDVQGSITKYSSNDQLIALEFGNRFLPDFEFELESEFAHTRRNNWGLRSLAFQLRYRFLDDLTGDPVSLVLFANVRYVPSRSLHDVSTPYLANFNGTIGTSIGKEFNNGPNWVYRVWGVGAIVQGNRGTPSFLLSLVGAMKFWEYNQFKLFADGYFGTSNRQTINVNNFYGYADYAHRSIDIGAGYQYDFIIWGYLRLDYAYRVYAHAYPERAQMVVLTYHLPFSLF